MTVAVEERRTDAVANRVASVTYCTRATVLRAIVHPRAEFALRSVPAIATRAVAAGVGISCHKCSVVGAVRNVCALEVASRIDAFVAIRAARAVLEAVELWRTEAAVCATPLVAARAVAAREETTHVCGMAAAVDRVGTNAIAARVVVIASCTSSAILRAIEVGVANRAVACAPRVTTSAVALRERVARHRDCVAAAVGRNRAREVAARIRVAALNARTAVTRDVVDRLANATVRRRPRIATGASAVRKETAD